MKNINITILLLILLAFGGCEKNSETVLNVAMGLTEEEWQVMKKEVFPLFEKRHDCKIKAYQVDPADWARKLKAMVTGGRVKVDVFSQDNMMLYPLVADGLVEDLTRYAEKIPPQISPRMRGIGSFNGKIYFFPYRPNVQIVYYNSAKFAECGLAVPQNWDELLSIAKIFRKKEGVGRVGMKLCGGGPTTAVLYEMIISAGGSPFEFNDPGCVKTFEFLKELYPYLSPDSRKAKWDTTNTYLANESFFIAQNWPFGINIIVKKYGKSEIKTYHGWTGPQREAHTIGGEVLGIPRGAKKKELALEFMLFLESKEVQEKLAKGLGWPSVRPDAYGEIAGWQRPYFESVKEALSHGVYRPNVLYWPDFDRFVNEAFTRIAVKGEDTVSVLDEYHGKMKKIIYAYGLKESH